MEANEVLMNTLNRLESKVDKIIDDMISIEDCKNNRDNCSNKVQWSTKKIIAVGSVITAIIGACGTIAKIILMR
jgi:hypothetical protein